MGYGESLIHLTKLVKVTFRHLNASKSFILRLFQRHLCQLHNKAEYIAKIRKTHSPLSNEQFVQYEELVNHFTQVNQSSKAEALVRKKRG